MAVPLTEFLDRSRANARAQDAVQEGRRGSSASDAVVGVNRPKFDGGKSKTALKLRGGLTDLGSGRIPETGCPLDPEAGLGGMFSLGLL
jgi:hypothetical protein